jgi:4-diphosphocytidyl-2-C-methyl-D-erythritol kinase
MFRKASKFKTSVDASTPRVVGYAALSTGAERHRRLVLWTSAKVNLALEVLGKRPDGYHEISTVLQAVDLFDRLTLTAAPGLSLRVSGGEVPADGDNLVLRAARLLQEAAGVAGGAAIRLDKRIPVAAGLGGGSSDAAATLLGLTRLWGLRWGAGRLRPLAERLGMDVPFFLGGGCAVGTGRGERLRALRPAGGHALVLVNPNRPLATKEVYGRVPAGWTGDAEGTARVVAALRRRDRAGLGRALTNDLEPLAAPLVPAVAQMKAALLAAGALGAVMSGSGPTVLGLAGSLDQARRIRERVRRRGWAAWAVRTISGPCVRIVQDTGRGRAAGRRGAGIAG